ncbi:NEDD8 ultimate buster 1 [Holothuria leucospilota]|uniref:NEDD8 ultimate buster 1 n=1 Tax=Holothuria leucospilota TaxID=206669 RepID=A0A9Q0YDH3_HOLLE|nr:NEDD8 ultimate buster 1 [Holothuria leucospilota]
MIIMAEGPAEVPQAIKDSIKRKLNSEKVKLWLPPFTQDNEAFGNYSENFVKQYSQSLNLTESVVIQAFEELRQHAVAKLAAKKQYQETGLATLKVKVPGNINTESGGSQVFSITIKLDEKGEALRQRIAAQVQLPSDSLKLIANGKVLESEDSLQSQGVTNHTHVMVVLLSESEREARQKEDSLAAIQRAKDAAQLLSNKKYGEGLSEDKFFLQITDQNGKALDLPAEERAALSVALTLNEKGRACLKKKDYSTAILFLLESESAFREKLLLLRSEITKEHQLSSHCRSDILQAVDNFAILCLDIVWCYLCLQHIDQLPSAVQKLKICEDSFRRAHGPNMERLQTIKGDKGKDLALYVKLFLLQGILCYHQGKITEAKRFLEKSESILKSIQVDETKLMQLVAMGYEVSDARLGLRAADGSISEAIAKITERKERKQKQAKQEKEEQRKGKLAKRLGKSANGEWIKVDVYEQLLGMGFPSGVIAEALKQTNSDLQLSLEAIQNHPEWYDVPDIPVEDSEPAWTGEITDAMLARFTEMGFEVNAAREALKQLKGNVEKAVQELMRHGGTMPTTSSNRQPTQDNPSKYFKGLREELSQNEKQAMAELADDIPQHDEDYLDITLEEEAQFLEEYKMLLASAASTS